MSFGIAQVPCVFAQNLVTSVWKTFPGFAEGLLVDKHFFHEPSCLYNEGVWHNCVFAVVSHKLGTLLGDATFAERAERTSQSLRSLNMCADRGVFRQRTLSPYWDHHPEYISKLYKPQFYSASSDVRSVSNAMALMLWSYLRGRTGELDCQYKSLLASFVSTFWSTEDQMWIASTSKKYFRAVDQALAGLALLRAKKVHSEGDPIEPTKIQEILTRTRVVLLKEFGYEHPSTIRGYRGAESGRFLWQDVWVVMFLLLTSDGPSTDEAALRLIDDCAATYTNERGLLTNEPCKLKGTSGTHSVEGVVVYTGDNSLYCLLLKVASELGAKAATAKLSEYLPVYQSWIQEITTPEGLLATADVYRDATYWASSETALSSLWSASDFI